MTLNWLDGKIDPFIRPGAVELQSSLHSQLIKNFANEDAAARFLSSDRVHWRRQAVLRSQHIMGKPISGTVLEIGAGSGWCSSLLSLMPNVNKIYCMDYDPVSVNTLIPQVQTVLSADASKIEKVYGTFNDIKLINELDFIVSIGALHHSENLFVTLSECFKALKPGGWLFATEPAYYDSENNRAILNRYKKEDLNSIAKYGRRAKHEENSDHYYRLCEYTAASYSSKFDTFPFVFDIDGNRNADDRALSERKVGQGFHKNVFFPYFAKDVGNPVFYSLLLMLQKPEDGGCETGHVLSCQGSKSQF